METSVVTVTPDQAVAWLEKNTKNRSLNERRIDEMVADMKNGQWRTTHQGICFDSSGALIDGQHRLWAVVTSGVSVDMMVTTGADPNDFTVLDTGRKRTTGDVLHVSGIANSNQVAAMSRLAMCYLRREQRPWIRRRTAITTPEVMAFVQENSDEVQSAVRLGGVAAARLSVSPAAVSSGLFLCARWTTVNDVDRTDYLNWVNGLATGANLGPGDPRLALSSWTAHAGRVLSSSIRTEVVVHAIARIFHGGMTGTTMTRLQINNPTTWTFWLPGDNFYPGEV